MASLDDFLSEIGVDSLSTVIELPTPESDATTKGPAASLHELIKAEVTKTDDRTLALLKDQWSNFAEQLRTGDTLVKQLKNEEEELKALEEEMDGPDAFLPPLLSHLETQQSLAAAHLLATTSVVLVSALLAFHSTVADLSEATTTGDLPKAVQELRSVSRAVEVGAEEWVEQTELWKTLIRWAADEETRLEIALQSAVEACFEIEVPSKDNNQTAQLVFRERVSAAPNGPELGVRTLLRGLEDLAAITGRKDQSETILVRLAKQILRHFIAPFLEANGPRAGDKAFAKTRCEFTLDTAASDTGVHRVLLRTSTLSGDDAIEGLSIFLAFLTDKSSLFPHSKDEVPSKQVAILTAHLTPSLQSHVISSHLMPSLPTSIAALDAYTSVLAKATAFEADFLPTHSLFAFLPASLRRDGHEVEEQRVIRSWASRVPHHWARHIGDSALARVRNSVKSWDWGAGEVVDVEVREEEEMLGLLLGLGLVDPEDEAAVAAAAAGDRSKLDALERSTEPSFDGKRRLPRELALQTVPKSAKREMTMEEALRPRICRPRPSPPPPPESMPPPAQLEMAELAVPASLGAVPAVPARLSKLGATKISGSTDPDLFGTVTDSLPADATDRDVSALEQSDPALPPAAEAAPPPSATPPVEGESAAPTIVPHKIDEEAVVVPAPSPGDSYAPFETPALTAAGIGTTADAALAEDVVQAHEYRATVDDEVGAEEETSRRSTPLTEANMTQPQRGTDHEATFDAVTSESTQTEARTGEIPAEGALETGSHEVASPSSPDHIKEESVEPGLTAVDDSLVGFTDEQGPLLAATSTDFAEQTVPIPADEARLLEAEAEGQALHALSPEDDAPLRLDALFPAEEVPSPFTPYASEDPSVAERGRSHPEPLTHTAPPPTPQQGVANTYGASPADTYGVDAAYFPIDDDPYADDSFAEDPYAYESYPTPTHDDFFSPPAGPPPPVEAFAPSEQASSTFPDPYAPSVVPHPTEETAHGGQNQQYAYAPPTQGPATPAGSALPSHPPLGSGTAAAPPPPPPPPRASASTSAHSVVAPRTKPPKRSLVGYSAFAPDRPGCLPQSANAATAGHAVPDAYASAHRVETPPSASLPARSLPQRSCTESPKPTLAPLRLGFTTSSRSNRSGTPDRSSGPITNHIQQRFVSPPPTVMNPYVPMALPPSIAPSASSYLPANDPLLAGLLSGVSNRSANVFSFAGKSTGASTSSYTANPPVEQVRAHDAQNAQSFVPAFGPEAQRYAPPYGHHAQYGAQPHSQPAMRMRGGCSLEQLTMAPALRLRGGADLGDMDDDGSHSADDWGFGDDEIAPDADDTEDAWGFQAESEETETPASPVPAVTSAPDRGASSAGRPDDMRKPLAHTANTSISSTISQPPSTSTSRPSSLTFAPSLVQPARSSLEIVDLDDGSLEGGDDAWGFDEEEANVQNDQAPVTLPDGVIASAVDSTAFPEMADTEKVVPKTGKLSLDAIAAGAAVHEIAASATSDNLDYSQRHDEDAFANHDADGEDEWGFGDDRGDLEPSSLETPAAPNPSAPSTVLPSTSVSEAAETPATEASESFEAFEVDAASQPLGASEPTGETLDDEEGDDDAWDLEPPPVDPADASPSAAENELDRSQADDGTGLQPRKAGSPDYPLAHSESLVEDTEASLYKADHTASTPADQHAPSTAHEDDHAEHHAGLLHAADKSAPPPPEPATALTAPATDLHGAFPDHLHQDLPGEEAALLSSSSTPSLPRPLPHSDDFVPGAVESPDVVPLLDYAAAKLEDAQLIEDEPQAAQSSALDAEGTDGHDELTDVEEFAGDRRAAKEWEQDMAVAETLVEGDEEEGAITPPDTTEHDPVESSPADLDDFADFTEHQAEQQPRTMAWEPFEEPTGEPESTPASAEGCDRRDAYERDGFSAEPSEVPKTSTGTETSAEDFGDSPIRRGSAVSAVPTVKSGVSGLQDHEDQLAPAVFGDAHRPAGHSVRDGQETEVPDDAQSEAAEATAAGAEILEADDPVAVPESPYGEESVVQHEDLRPWPRDDSSVQHESLRPIVTEAVAPGILLPSQEAHPQQRTFSPPPTALPMQEDELADWEFDDDTAGAEVLADSDFVHEAAGPPIPEESAVQHVADRPLLADDATHAENGIEVAGTVAQPQQHTFSPSPSNLPLADQSDDDHNATNLRHAVEEDLSAPTSSKPAGDAAAIDAARVEGNNEVSNEGPAFAGAEQRLLPTEPSTAISTEESACPVTELVQDEHQHDVEHQHDIATDSSQILVNEEHPNDYNSRGPSGIGEGMHPSPLAENVAEDPWDLDPLEPDDAVADFAEEALTASQPNEVARKLAVADDDSRAALDSTPTESGSPEVRDPSPGSETSPDPSGRKVDQLVTNPDLARPPADAIPRALAPASSPPSSARGSLSPRQTASTPEATLDSWRWDDEEAVPKPEPLELPGSPGFEAEAPAPDASSIPAEKQAHMARHEKMMVSRQSREIVAMAEEILSTAFEIASPSFVLPQFGPASEPLLRHFVSILSLYRATASVHNSNLLASVPAIAMQFANDAEWIGREANRLWDAALAKHADQVSQDQKRDVQLAIQSMRQLGRDTRQRQISIQQAALMESLDEAGGFLRTSDENRFSACERALQQVTHILQRLALVWKPIMTPTALYTALGGLVNEVLLRVLDEIEEQTDISEEESIRLNRLSKMLHELESLFDGSDTNVGREVPIWYKFSFLSELLEASMADFMFLFDNRFLLDFTPQELVRLLRALFADSPQRDAAVKRILQGHPEATADAEEES